MAKSKKSKEELPQFSAEIQNLLDSYAGNVIKDEICELLNRELTFNIYEHFKDLMPSGGILKDYEIFRVHTKAYVNCFDKSSVLINVYAFLKSEVSKTLCILRLFPSVKILALCKMNSCITCHTDVHTKFLLEEYREWKKEVHEKKNQEE